MLGEKHFTIMKNFKLDSFVSWFCAFIGYVVTLIGILSEPTGEDLSLRLMSYAIAFSILFLLIVIVAWGWRRIKHGSYPIIGFKEVLIVLGGSYILPLVTLLFRPENYWGYVFSLLLVFTVSRWVQSTCELATK